MFEKRLKRKLCFLLSLCLNVCYCLKNNLSVIVMREDMTFLLAFVSTNQNNDKSTDFLLLSAQVLRMEWRLVFFISLLVRNDFIRRSIASIFYPVLSHWIHDQNIDQIIRCDCLLVSHILKDNFLLYTHQRNTLLISWSQEWWVK